MTGLDPYLYPGSAVLRNKLDLHDADALDVMERRLVTARIIEGVPSGRFDLVHLRAIHRHLFQDVYEWAGEVRTVEIAKGGHQFQFRQYIETGMADVHRRLVSAGYLHDLSREDFADAAGKILGDVNYIHPFREGNGRTQLLYLEQLAEQAGHPVDLSRIDPARWVEASRAAHNADYGLMAEEIGRCIEGRSFGRER
jgi:cell filamentation protein